MVILGSGIRYPADSGDPSVGFRAIYFVAARTIREAESEAVERLRNRWDTFYFDSAGELVTEIDEIEPTEFRFLLRSRRYGLIFHRDDAPARTGGYCNFRVAPDVDPRRACRKSYHSFRAGPRR